MVADGNEFAGARLPSVIIERTFADGTKAAGDRHDRQSTAAIEHKVSGGGHARQTTAPTERPSADGGEAAGEGHARQTTAPRERILADGGNWKLANSGKQPKLCPQK